VRKMGIRPSFSRAWKVSRLNVQNTTVTSSVYTVKAFASGKLNYSPPGGVRSIAINVSVCLSVGLSVFPLVYLKNHMSEFHEIFCSRYLWPWFDAPLTSNAVLPVLWMTSCFHTMGQIGLVSATANYSPRLARWHR